MLNIIGLLLATLSVFVRGWAIKLTWLWFVAPVTGLRPISTAAAYGLALFLSALSLSVSDLQAAITMGKDDKNLIVYPLASMGVIVYTVVIGYVIKTYFL